MKNFRVRYTWGNGSCSFDYYATSAEAKRMRHKNDSRIALTLMGAEYTQYAQRSVVQEKVKGRWVTI